MAGLEVQTGKVPGTVIRSTPAPRPPFVGLLIVVSALVAGWNFFPKGLLAARRLSLDMNFLMTVAIFG